MAFASVPWWISAVWVSLTFLAFLALGASSVGSWVLATTIGLVPACVLLRLWNDGPPPTVAEIVRATEVGR
jgi:hypothetical protein